MQLSIHRVLQLPLQTSVTAVLAAFSTRYDQGNDPSKTQDTLAF